MRHMIEEIRCDRCKKRLDTDERYDATTKSHTTPSGNTYDLCPACVEAGWELVITREGNIVIGKATGPRRGVGD